MLLLCVQVAEISVASATGRNYGRTDFYISIWPLQWTLAVVHPRAARGLPRGGMRETRGMRHAKQRGTCRDRETGCEGAGRDLGRGGQGVRREGCMGQVGISNPDIVSQMQFEFPAGCRCGSKVSSPAGTVFWQLRAWRRGATCLDCCTAARASARRSPRSSLGFWASGPLSRHSRPSAVGHSRGERRWSLGI